MHKSPAIRWSTEDVPQAERFDYWRDSICAAFDPMSPELKRDRRVSFRGDIATWKFGEATLMEIRATSHCTGRSLHDIARGSRHYVYLYKQRAKAWFNFDYQDSFTTGPGALVFGDADRPFTTGPNERCGFHHWVLKLPRATFEPVLARPHDIDTRIVSAPTGIGALLSCYFDALLVEAPRLPLGDQRAALHALTTLTAAAYGRLTTDNEPHNAVRTAQLLAGKQMIERHIASPALTPALIAQRLGISVRLLHKLFEPSGTTVSRYILGRRLELAREHLERRQDTVLTIALDCGFESLATFYRTFRQAYGVTPADYRSSLIR
ncbi:MAG: helix-turn-helix domain-containing protein [Rhizobiales bacterium]|nr:helix-turn-helix domain-containing protein [Hyphomicrobiales bacterium]